ncbi:MAG TPA: HYR domain-containing protein [Thermoanaerobaculia bacterium]|nr:HYR domain-containing protein [Thermoanaerobaculia bacterium]
MRKSIAVAFLLLLFSAFGASAGTITSINPSSFRVNSGEHFITVYGTDLGNRLIFDGPAGHFEVNVTAQFSGSVAGWVPESIIAMSGTYTLNVSGPNGNSGPITFAVKGFRLPLMLLVPEYIRVQPRSIEGAGVKYEVIAIGGDDPNPVVTCEPASGSMFKMGITRVSCGATNSYGERATAAFDVTVRDETPPVLTVPFEPIVVKAASREGAVVDYKVTAWDGIYGELRTDCLPMSGSNFPIGITNVQCTATDPDLNIGHGSFAVEVLGDREPYTLDLHVPDTILVEAYSPEGSPVKYDVRVTGTKDPYPSVFCDPKSGSTFPIGETLVSCTAIDEFGMRGSASFTVHVMDVVAPQILGIAASPDLLMADNRLYPINIDVSAVDDIDMRPVCEIYSVTSKENINLDDGQDPKLYDWLITGPLSLELRAERQTTQRVYNVWVACSDYFGNVTRTRTTVTVSGGVASQMTGPLGGKRRSAR